MGKKDKDKVRSVANAKARLNQYYNARYTSADSKEGENMSSKYLADLRDKHPSKGSQRNIYDQTASAYSAERSSKTKDWNIVEKDVASLRSHACSAFGRDMLAEDPSSKVGAALLQRSDGTSRVKYGFTAPKFPGDTSDRTRKDRVDRIESQFEKLKASPPKFSRTSNSVPGSCVEAGTFQRVLSGEPRNVSGTLTTTTMNMGAESARTSAMCGNCVEYSSAIEKAYPNLKVVDRG